jgi:DeoR/GlpR family transcriptional regulator of sugar metabolism
MAAAADRVYVVADHTKIGRTALARTGTLTRWAGLICDRGLDAAAARRLRRQGITVILPNATHKGVA